MAVYLIRHGESVANAFKNLARHPEFKDTADDDVPLTQWGFEQAVETGKALREELMAANQAGRKIKIICSPFLRTIQTLKGLQTGLGEGLEAEVYSCDYLREQSFGLFNCIEDLSYIKRQWPEEYAKFTQERQRDKFHATPPQGESRADVVKRAGLLVEAYHETFEDPDADIILVGHGMSNRAVELQLTVGAQLAELGQDEANRKKGQWLQKQRNPKNCAVRKLEGNLKDGYTRAECIYEAKVRASSMRKDYKTRPYGTAAASLAR